MKFSAALLTSALVCFVSSSIARDIPLAARYAIEVRQKNGGGKGGDDEKKGGKGGDDPETSLTLDSSVINSNFAKTGQEGKSEAGQVASLTSKNNFINFCVGKKLTNGQQVKGGSCNSTPMGELPSTSKQPSSKFTSPKNLDTIPADKAFTVKMAVKNMEMGNFVNPQTNYFGAPQQLNSQGTIIAHSHIVIEQIDSLTSTKVSDPNKFAFFQGLNAAAEGGVVSATVTNGLPAGTYKISSINTSANHAPVVGPVAQHGSFDDVIYITVGDDGNGDDKGGKGGKGGDKGGKKGRKLVRRFASSREGKARL